MKRINHSLLIIAMLLVGATIGYSQHTQLRYVKTTDFGATWSDPTQAGDVSTLWSTSVRLPDFSAVAMNNNELCYAVPIAGGSAPGIYSFSGPGFSPVLIMAQGSNTLNWANIGKTPNGDLFVVIWGTDASATNTLWGAKSTNSGTSWTTFVVGAEPTIPEGAEYFQISDMNSATYCFVQFNDVNYEQYVMRFPVAGGAGTFVDLGTDDAASGGISFYIGQCKPIAYDPTANALYACHRATDNSAVTVHYSDDMGLSFTSAAVGGTQRYPSMALRPDGYPFVISNYGVPAAGAAHVSWWSYDELGYNGGSWTPPDTIASIIYDGPGPLLYINQAYFWSATQGIASHNLWGASTPEGLYTSRTTNGGMNWGSFTRQWQWEEDTYDPGSCSQNEVVGGTNGTAYVIFCARVGAPDTTGHHFSDLQLLTPPTSLGPYSLSAYVSDNNVDDTDNHISFWINGICAEGVEDTTDSDSSHIVDQETNTGTYFFHIPNVVCGHTIAAGDTIWYYMWGRDLGGNAGASAVQGIVAGSAWLGVDIAPKSRPLSFRLAGNYPNPFNPSTDIVFDLATDNRISLSIFNTLGQKVRDLVSDQAMGAGTHQVRFDASDLPSGIYIYTLSAGDVSDSRKMVLIK